MFDLKKLESSEFYHRRRQNFATLIIFPILAIFIFICLFAFIAKKELTVKSLGTIEPTRIIQQIQSTGSGNILENNLKEGLAVKKNQLLIRYDISQSTTEAAQYQLQLSQAKAQQTQLAFLEVSLNAGTNQFPLADKFGYYQTFQDYLAQTQVLTDTINRTNQALTDQNSTVTSSKQAIKAEKEIISDELNNLTALKNAVAAGVAPSASNTYCSQYVDYQSQIADKINQKTVLQAQFISNIQANIDSVQSQIDSLNSQISQLSTTNPSLSGLKNQLSNLKTQLQNYQEVKNASSAGSIKAINPYKSLYTANQSQLISVDNQINSLKAQTLSNLQSQIDTLQNTISSLTTQEAGLSSSNSYDTSLSGQLAALKAQELLKTNQEETSLKNSITDLETKLKLLKQSDKDGSLKVSKAGVIHVLPNILGLKKISVGTPIAELYPALKAKAKVKVTVYIPSGQISALSIGQPLRFQVQQNLPKPVILSGKVSKIDSAPTKDKAGNYYGVEAIVSLTKADIKKMRYGLQGKVTIVTGRKTYFNYYKDKLTGNE
jgi:competence factor transport accessory protein ComB